VSVDLFLFPDTTVVINFAVIDRLDLLTTYLSGRARMTQAVQAEVRKSALMVPHLAQFDMVALCGPAIVLNAESDRAGVAMMRKRFAAAGDSPTKHLGESETLYVMTSRVEFSVSRILTEDRDAYRVAKALELLAVNTFEIFQALVARGELDSRDAFDLLAAIEDSPYDRTLIARPTRPQDLLAS